MVGRSIELVTICYYNYKLTENCGGHHLVLPLGLLQLWKGNGGWSGKNADIVKKWTLWLFNMAKWKITILLRSANGICYHISLWAINNERISDYSLQSVKVIIIAEHFGWAALQRKQCGYGWCNLCFSSQKVGSFTNSAAGFWHRLTGKGK